MNEAIQWITTARSRGLSWETILLANRTTEKGLEEFLQTQQDTNFWPKITVSQWQSLVEERKAEEKQRKTLIDKEGVTVIHDPQNEINEIEVPTYEDSAWQCYKRTLIARAYPRKVIDLMEDTNNKILRQLSRNTREIEPIKGLVIGNVQSGKTANMAALIAMAADAGWNMFVVLSGMLENLRLQNSQRLINDLGSFDSRLTWRTIENPCPAVPYQERLERQDFSEESNQRYLFVCLKQHNRLEGLINWLNTNAGKREQIRLLVIDDEADQASINAATDDERRTINRLILNLINNKDVLGRNAKSKFEAVNYVGYTATPYANVLNETPGLMSLYPSNFIATLPVSNEYFGPQQIFGYDGNKDDEEDTTLFPGLDIVRSIPDEDITSVRELQSDSGIDFPQSLVDSISWFLCGVACMRHKNYQKPVSMLIHTSRNTDHHNQLAIRIQNFFSEIGPELLIQNCREIWERESERFTPDRFKEQYPSYAHNDRLNDYPSFDNLEPIIRDLLKQGLTQYTIDENNNQRIYSNGIHLCIDNSDRNNIDSRLIYPEENEMPCCAPAFIVIGGNTLSRGLTIEGLISTYFIRPANCADTLMQMGRWFGYRKGYELIPRMWLSQRTRDQFEFMAEMDQRLRDEIKQMGEIGVSPSECGPKIMTSPSTRFLDIVARNRRQAAINAEFDFSGHTMETGVFSNNREALQENLGLLSRYIRELGSPDKIDGNPYANTNKVWLSVPLASILEFLTQYKYSERLRGFNDLSALMSWLSQVTENGMLGDWNVILAGASSNEKIQITDEISIGKVNRSRRNADGFEKNINIGVLRSFNDFLSDITINDDEQRLSIINGVKHNTRALNRCRENLNMAEIPQLVIYVIDKNSHPRPGANKRFPLNACEDIVGFSINIPGNRSRSSAATHITINIQPMEDYNDQDD